jgi:hypothetical protein
MTNAQIIAQKREGECAVESRAIELRMAAIKRMNWLTVVLPSLVSAFAGAEILTSVNQEWKYVVGGATLTASLLMVLHKALNCDAY